MKRAVFLDRDGVINRAFVRGGKPYPPASLEELEILPGVAQAIEQLSAAGFLIIVATNQPDVATGIQQLSVVEAMHEHLRRALLLNDIRVCYHISADACACRKPKPGMLLAAAHDWEIDLAQSFMVGDRWRDIEAGHAAGCQAILVGDGYGEKTIAPEAIVASLWEASQLILSGKLEPHTCQNSTH